MHKDLSQFMCGKLTSTPNPNPYLKVNTPHVHPHAMKQSIQVHPKGL